MKKILILLILICMVCSSCKNEEAVKVDPTMTLPSTGIEIGSSTTSESNEVIIEGETTLEGWGTSSTFYDETTGESWTYSEGGGSSSTSIAIIETTEETIEETSQETIPETPEEVKEDTTEYDPINDYSFTEVAKIMYTNCNSNVRELPTGDSIKITTLKTNTEVTVTGVCNETGWYRVLIDGRAGYMSSELLSDEKVTSPVANTGTGGRRHVPSYGGFVYYHVSTGSPNYDYEKYLWDCLNNLGIGWWYKWAVAQIWQESCWSPQSYNGVDAGICQFNEASFSRRAAHHANFPDANVWNPYDSLYVYSYYIRDILVGCNYDVNAALSYYIKGHWNDPHQGYINAVTGRYNSLWTD